MAKKRTKKTAKQKLIDSTRTKIKNREKKLEQIDAEYEAKRSGVQEELDELRELLKALTKD